MHSPRGALGYPILLLLHLLCSLPPSWTFSLKEDSPIVFSGSRKSYFGLTVKLHKNSAGARLLVGSPRANTTFEASVVEPGGLFVCDFNRGGNCNPFALDRTGDISGGSQPEAYADLKSGQWMGVALDASQGPNGHVLICGHRWINRHFGNHYLINGACYVMDAEMNTGSIQRLLPLINSQKQFPNVGGGTTGYGFCYGQAGISAAISNTGVMAVGAPGVYYWQGAVIRYDESITNEIIEIHDLLDKYQSFSYTGYSTAVGRLFSSSGSEQIVLGAPRADSSGTVLVIGLKSNVNMEVITRVDSYQFGSYFGAAVCVIDLNADGLDDLLVGAPLYLLEKVSGGDHGSVFVYISKDGGTLAPESESLVGLKKPSARFGQAIASAGKILNLHYNSFVVGAPYEDEGNGAIYIYTGMSKQFSQRIGASSGMKGFGYGISGNLDVDSNGYPDIAVGAYASDQAAVYLARPVVNLAVEMTFDKDKIDLEKGAYDLDNKLYPALSLLIKLNYTGVQVPPSLEVEYMVEADFSTDGLRGNRGWLVSGRNKVTKLTKTVELLKEQLDTIDIRVVFEASTKDVTTPFNCKLSLKLINEERHQVMGLVPLLNTTMVDQVLAHVHYVKKCGSDDRCDSELRLKQTVSTPTNEEYLILGDARPFDLQVSVENAGEAAYQSVVEFEHPIELRFRSLTQTQNRQKVSCLPWQPTPGVKYQLGLPTSEIYLLKCEVGNPVNANQTVNFRITFDAQKISNYQKSLIIATVANTTSNETLPHNNRRNATVPFVVLPDIKFTGISVPDQLQFEGNSQTSRARRDANDTLKNEDKNKTDAPIAFEHFYEIKNTGHGVLPRAYFDLNIPHKTMDTDEEVSSKIQVTMTTYSDSGSVSQTCGQLRDKLDPFPVEKPSQSSDKLVEVEKGMEPLDMDCNNTQCIGFQCLIKDIRARDSALIKVAVQMTTLDKIVGNRITYFFTESRLRFNMTKVKSGPPYKWENVIYYRLVGTTLYPRQLVPRRFKVKLWVLLVAIGGGVLGLICMIVILYKLGFFRRQRVDDTQRLVQENDDNETQEAREEVGVKPPTAGGRDDIPGYGDNASNNANHAAYTAQSRTGPMYGQLSMIDDNVSDNGNNNNNNNGGEQEKREIEEDRDEDGGVLVYSSSQYQHPPAPPVPDYPLTSNYDTNPLYWRPPAPPLHSTSSRDGYLLPVERRQI